MPKPHAKRSSLADDTYLGNTQRRASIPCSCVIFVIFINSFADFELRPGAIDYCASKVHHPTRMSVSYTAKGCMWKTASDAMFNADVSSVLSRTRVVETGENLLLCMMSGQDTSHAQANTSRDE